MTYEYKITLTLTETGESISVAGNFQEDEWNLLNEFLEYADDLLKTKFVKNGMPASLNVKIENEKDTVFSVQLPDWNEVIVFLHKFRPIRLQSESTNFYKICNILAKELKHPYYRSMIAEQVEIYNGKRTQSMFQVRSEDVILNSEKVLNDWLNSFEDHRDKEKRKFIESLHEMFPLDASKVLFLGLLSDKTQAILHIAILTRVVVGKQKSMEGIVKLKH